MAIPVKMLKFWARVENERILGNINPCCEVISREDSPSCHCLSYSFTVSLLFSGWVLISWLLKSSAFTHRHQGCIKIFKKQSQGRKFPEMWGSTLPMVMKGSGKGEKKMMSEASSLEYRHFSVASLFSSNLSYTLALVTGGQKKDRSSNRES